MTQNCRKWLVTLSLGAVAAGLIMLALLGFMMPPDARSGWWINYPGSAQFREHVPCGQSLPILDVPTFHSLFRIALVTSWVGYAGLLPLVRAGSMPRSCRAIAYAMPFIVAIGCPSYLSSDVYKYALDGRLFALYDRNPYGLSLAAPSPDGDPAKAVVGRDDASPYGPIWHGMVCGIIFMLRAADLWYQIVALKILEAIMLLLAARWGRDITRQLRPNLAELTFYAIAMNPLLLLEGPGSGHNDITQMAFFMLGARLLITQRPLAGAAAIGMSIAIKLLPLVVVPWLMIDGYRRAGLTAAVKMAALCLLIPVVCYLPFAQGSTLDESLRQHFVKAQNADAEAKDPEFVGQLNSAGTPGALVKLAAAVWQHRLIILIYLAATVGVVRSRWPGAWLEAWVVVSMGLIIFLMGKFYPWYLTWPLVPALTAACRFGLFAGSLGSVLGFFLTWRYTLEW